MNILKKKKLMNLVLVVVLEMIFILKVKKREIIKRGRN